MNNKMNNIYKQKGFVSIVITSIIITLVTIIVIGFAQLARREQRESLDRQLNTQAFYAAESGINDARKKLLTDPDYESTSCDSNQLSGPDVEYSCLQVRQLLNNIKLQSVGTVKSFVVPLNTVDSNKNPKALRRLTIKWKSTDKNSGISNETSANNKLLNKSEWGNNLGMLRIDLIPIDGFSNLSVDSLRTNTFTAFAYPTRNPSASGSNDISYSKAFENGNGLIHMIKCSQSSPYECSMAIEFRSIADTSDDSPYVLPKKYMLRIKSIYNPTEVTICPGIYDDSETCDDSTYLKDAQIEIDSTGRVGDVLKRVQVRINKSKSNNFPEYVLESSQDICKKMNVTPSNTTYGSCSP